MNVDVDNLSDDELRSKLLEYGFPVMPITGTTRKVMVKKLKMLLENRNKVNKDNRRSLGRYSSGDESDSDAKPKKDKNRRATMAAPSKPLNTKTSRYESGYNDGLKRESRTVTTTSSRTERILRNADEYETGSESDEIADKYEPKRESPNENYKKSSSPISNLPPSFISAALTAEAASDKINQIRARRSQYNSNYSFDSTDDLLKDKENTPFLSNFTKRLSRLSESPKVYDYKSDIIKENDVNGGSTRTYLNSLRSTRGRTNTYDYQLTNQSIFKNNFVPFMVLVVAVLFFIIVAIVYLGIRSDASLEITANIPKCVESEPKLKMFVNCVVDGDEKSAIHLFQVLKSELDRRAVKNKCEDSNAKPYMTEQDIITYITSHYSIKDENRVKNDLANLKVLLFANPLWGLSLLQLDEDGASFDENAITKDMLQLIEGRNTKVTALISRHPYIPWKCYFYNTIWAFLSVLTSFLGAILILYIFNYIYKFYKQKLQKQQQEEMSLIEDIINVLQANAAQNEDNYLVINHVRDMLLPVMERKKKQKLWSRAVKYINENESRIRTEEHVVQGEISEVWRWLGGPNLSTSKSKSWQGQAFETQVGSVNCLPCSPTPCLKIRGMVEEGDRNKLAIKKAVLSKCAQKCRILHCEVDLNSKCVYLKCADTSDAATAHRNLHGWWYAGNLVTVKYLRLERYMHRFPDSPISGPPFL